MGVGGKFWELLKPYARHEGFDYLRDKRVAVDLSYWIVQHETAIKTYTRNPHLRLTFFRTINLFSKFGAFPVFVVDGTPSPLKSQARFRRYFRSSGIECSSLPVADIVSVERNGAFQKFVQDCVELLELFGMPVLKADSEAEALCAQLNKDGHVDACITADSDAFLFGAICVIKCLRPNSKEPFECYHMVDIETGLGLKRKHLIAISLLVGNDHDLDGVQGIGLNTALRFVKNFSEDEILKKLHEIGNEDASPFPFPGGVKYVDDVIPSSDGSSPKIKCSHCSICGHPGSKRAHFKFSCEYCGKDNNQGCMKKSEGFKCNCPCCDEGRKEKEQKKHEDWWVRVCNKITLDKSFPNEEIIEMYLRSSHGKFNANRLTLSWEDPKTEFLVDFLAFHLHWEPSYIRQQMLPMLSTIYLREMARHPMKTLLYGQYEFHCIQRIKIRYGYQFYVVKWKKATSALSSTACTIPVEEPTLQEENIDADEPINVLDQPVDLHIHVDDGCCFLLTDENMELVHLAFPEEVDRFLQAKELKESKRTKTSALKSGGSSGKSESPKPKGVQLSITEFYRSAKVQHQEKPTEDVAKSSSNSSEESSKEKRKLSNPNLPKAVRRRLLFG